MARDDCLLLMLDLVQTVLGLTVSKQRDAQSPSLLPLSGLAQGLVIALVGGWGIMGPKSSSIPFLPQPFSVQTPFSAITQVS